MLMLMNKILKQIEFVHSRRILHRDIKPANFLMGHPKDKKGKKEVYLVDFGLAKKWSRRSGEHIVERKGRSMTGTIRFCSINVHLGIEQSRRDDLEAIGYMGVWMAKGNLPWCGLKARTIKEKYEKIEQRKLASDVPEICAGLPSCYANYLKYCRGLKFDQAPDYSYLRQFFKDAARDQDIQFDNVYDWSDPSNTKKNKK